jgi:hypothetical protein
MDVLSTDDTILEDVDLKIKSEKLRRYITTSLGRRERAIIELRYGICGCKPKTQREVASMLGISRSYVSRIEKKALLDLRGMFEGEESGQHPRAADSDQTDITPSRHQSFDGQKSCAGHLVYGCPAQLLRSRMQFAELYNVFGHVAV